MLADVRPGRGSPPPPLYRKHVLLNVSYLEKQFFGRNVPPPSLSMPTHPSNEDPGPHPNCYHTLDRVNLYSVLFLNMPKGSYVQ